MSDMDHADWLNGAEMPPCTDCNTPTTKETIFGEPLCAKCHDLRDEEAWMRQQAAQASGGTSAGELSDRAYADRRTR
jgi:hypothetical protein